MTSKLQFNFEVYIQTHICEMEKAYLLYRIVLRFRDEVHSGVVLSDTGKLINK